MRSTEGTSLETIRTDVSHSKSEPLSANLLTIQPVT